MSRQMNDFNMRHLPMVVLLSAIGLAGCGQLSETFGYGKNPPDEFSVIRKAPLIIPPDYQLKPPNAAAVAPQRATTQDKARAILTNAAPPDASKPPSEGERKLLSLAGATNSSDAIRTQIDRDGGTVIRKQGNFVERILFGRNQPDDETLDAEAEAERIKQ